jgi:hypothetical protein
MSGACSTDGEVRYAHNILVCKFVRMRPLLKPRRRSQYNIKSDKKYCVHLIQLSQDKDQLWSIGQLSDYQVLKNDSAEFRHSVSLSKHLCTIHKRLVAGFSPRRPGFALRADHVEFVVDRVALGQVFLRVLRCSPVNIIPPLLHIHSCIIWEMDKGPVRDPVPGDISPSQQ